jgi:DNA modification methylase
MPKLAWENKRISIDQLKPAAYNPRTATEKQFTDVSKSLEKFDLASPIVINRNNTVIGGHLRLQVLKKRGITEVDVRVPSRQLSDEEEKELNIRLNKNTGEWDYDLLGSGHFEKEFLSSAGFSRDELGRIFDLETEEDKFDAAEAYEKIHKPKTKAGQIYELDGGHRLMCGDSTDLKDWNKLMAGSKANMVFTDPPYNVNYDYTNAYKGGRKTYSLGKMFDDNKTPDDFQKFISEVFENLLQVTADNAAFYCWHASKTQQFFQHGIEDAGWKISQTIFWLKNQCTFNRGLDYLWIIEPCFFGWKAGKSHYVNKKLKLSMNNIEILNRLDFEQLLEVLYSKRDKITDYIHPTQKPIQLAERAIKKHSEEGGIVVDAFAGSGSTLMACKQLGRRCYTMEIDPKFCDVIVQRFEKKKVDEPVSVAA